MLLSDSGGGGHDRKPVFLEFHLVRLIIVSVLAGVAFAGYFAEWAYTGLMPGGSSLSGGLAGVFAGLLMVYLFLYAARKVWPFRWLFADRRMAHQLARHIWFGILTFPLVMLHSGLFMRWGGPLTIVLLSVYLGVFLSGVYLLWQQQRLPHDLLGELTDETVRSRIPDVTKRLRYEAQLLIRAACGPPADGEDVLNEDDPRRNPALQPLHQARRGRGVSVLKPVPQAVATPEEGTTLWRYYFQHVDPFLQPTLKPGLRLALPSWADSDFADLKLRVRSELHPILEAIQQACNRRRQFDRQVKLHDWLHAWVGIHLVISTMLLILLVWHGVTAVLYW